MRTRESLKLQNQNKAIRAKAKTLKVAKSKIWCILIKEEYSGQPNNTKQREFMITQLFLLLRKKFYQVKIALVNTEGLQQGGLHSGRGGGGHIRLCRLKTSKTASERQNFGANETMINYFYLLMMWLLIEVAGGILKFKSFTLQNWSDGASRRKRIMTRRSPRVSRRKQMGFPSAAKPGTWSQPKRIKLKAEKWTNNNNQEWVR